MFILAIETQMASAIQEIDSGCQPHSKEIFTRRDELLQAELAMLFRGQQGVFRFLEHCSSVLYVRNQEDVELSSTRDMEKVQTRWTVGGSNRTDMLCVSR